MTELPVPEEQMVFDEPMSAHTTMRVGGPADRFVRIRTEEELVGAVRALRASGEKFAVVGRGSNLIVPDEGFRGTVLCTAGGLSEISAVEAPDGGMLITAGGGALLSAVAAFCLENEQTGFEFAAGIPGTVGGGVRMNAGAYGGELKDIISSARLITRDGDIVSKGRDEMELGYRHSSVKDLGEIVLACTFSTKKGDKREIAAKMEELSKKRREKQPLELPSAGSTWKRPEGGFAAKLIEEAGCKGLSVGGAQISEKHAGFLVNRSDATCADILSLIALVERRVFESSGVKLALEVELL